MTREQSDEPGAQTLTLITDGGFTDELCALVARHVVSGDAVDVAKALLRTASGVLLMIHGEQASSARYLVQDALRKLRKP